ncbi:class I SAM-dependent methyltransferase [Magnetospirillum sp. 64-120]|uniref:class I SAM-dependent methyltransferase n=1 Tax=Magnetospirillum sp. 64-120 TaxID=1895778 RepID=UPI0009277DD3|nr:class I SAM-dependent methyltransferase [Magnetospirillum sp. 64-120]OJX68170.1 MAG: hypothetical protein BGO92_05820 [Magnetospirillum sp. 64-120]
MMDGVTVYDGHDLEALSDLPRYQDWILSRFAPHLCGDVIEYGAGIGNIARMVRPQVSRLTLVEPALNLLPRLRERFADDPAVTVAGASIEEHAALQPEASYDAVMLVNVLEHVVDDGLVLRQFHRLLRPGGHLLLFVPALPALFSKMDKILGHHRRYRRVELSDAVQSAGLTVRRCHYLDAAGALAWWLVFTKGGSTCFDPTSAMVFDRAVVPVMRPLENLCRPPWGKNLVLVAQKTQS